MESRTLKAFIVLCLATLSVCSAQELKIKGTVRDAGSGEALPFANVFVKDGTRGTSTIAGGFYELKLQPGVYEILASTIGYKTETFRVTLETQDVQLDIRLSSTDLILQEVAVYSPRGSGDEHEVSSMSIRSEEIVRISSITSDVFRSIQSLPGIAVDNELSAKFNVRGGNYDENLVLVNDTQVYEPFHLKEADNASVGIFNMDLMRKVHLITGGFSAQYGDRLSSVLNIEYREGSRERFGGSATVSLTSFTGVCEGPFLPQGSFILGIRKSYTEYLLSLISIDDPITVSFYDIQGVMTYDITRTDKLQVKVIHAGDDFREDPNAGGFGPNVRTGTFNNSPARFTVSDNTFQESKARYFTNLIDIKNSVFLSNDALLTASLSYYDQVDNERSSFNDTYRNDFIADDFPGAAFFYSSFYEERYDNRLTIRTLESKITLDAKVTPFYEVKTGFSYLNIHYGQNLIDRGLRDIRQNYEQFPDTMVILLDENFNTFPQNTDARSYKLAGYAENIMQLGDNLMLNAGVRVDYFDFNRDLTISPRLSASCTIGGETTLRAAWGHYYQSPIYAQLAYSIASDSNTQSQKAEQYILSLERNSTFGSDDRSEITLKVEGYYKKYSALISSTRSNSGKVYYSRRNDAKGYATGMDLYASVRVQGYYGWASYGLLFAEEDLLGDDQGSFPRYTDQRHTLSLVNDIDLGKEWSLNLRFTYGSGFAFTPFHVEYNTEEGRYTWVEGRKNSEHLPEYKRVDMRLAKEFELFGLPAFAFLDVSNLFNFANVFSIRYRYDGNGSPYREDVELWPILPSIGMTVKF